MARDSSANYHQFLIALTWDIGILQVLDTDENACDQNDKLYNLSYPLPLDYCD